MERPLALMSAEGREPQGAVLGAESELLARARAMDSDAWDELYSVHFAAICRYAAFRLGDTHAAEDVAAEVFLAAVKGIKSYRDRGKSFRAWLYGIAHNLTADECRRRSRQAARQDLPASDPADPLDVASGVALRRDLSMALARLTGEQQHVVILRFVEGLAVAEVAAITGKPVGAVKSTQHRALARLRRLIDQEVA